MKRFMQSIFVALALCSGCSKPRIVGPRQFTNEVVENLRKTSPGLKLEIAGDMELKLKSADGNEISIFLDNAYDMYKADPKSKDEIIKKYVSSMLDTASRSQTSEALDRTRIVPVIKDRPWLDETRKALMSRGATKMLEYVYEVLNSDLIILYAEDSPKNIRYFGAEDLEKARIGRNELKKLACDNLKRILPKIERRGGNGLYVIAAGGDYEASLLHFDSIWKDLQKDVRGEVVVAIPTRDLLMVTGSQDAQGIEKMKQFAQQASDQGSYRLTTDLFVYRDGKFERFEVNARTNMSPVNH